MKLGMHLAVRLGLWRKLTRAMQSQKSGVARQRGGGFAPGAQIAKQRYFCGGTVPPRIRKSANICKTEDGGRILISTEDIAAVLRDVARKAFKRAHSIVLALFQHCLGFKWLARCQCRLAFSGLIRVFL
jgi:hypothetical protein